MESEAKKRRVEKSNSTEQPSSSISSKASTPPPPSTSSTSEVETLNQNIKELQSKYMASVQAHKDLLAELKATVECPVCFNTPREPPVPICRNGHVICRRCKSKCDNCPTCRTKTIDCVSQIAAAIITKVSHPCDFRDEGCSFKGRLDDMTRHERNCEFRTVRCPHWACDELITVRNLTHHVIAAECGDSYRDKPLPYREEMVYTQALNDEEGNGFWKPSLLQYDGITFYLQVEKCGRSKNWYFYIQMEGSQGDAEKYATIIKVSKNLTTERNSVVYNGVVCPIDIKGASEVEASGAGLNIRDAAMEKIFDINTEKDDDNGDKHDDSSDKSEDEDKGYKFWVDVDIYKVSQASSSSSSTE